MHQHITAGQLFWPICIGHACVTQDPMYCGTRAARERGKAYYALVDEVVDAIQVRGNHNQRL